MATVKASPRAGRDEGLPGPRHAVRAAQDRTPAAGAMVTPLSAVLDALRRARERGELSDNEIMWSVNRLSDRTRPGNPGVKGLDRRESILQASAQIFQRRGYHHTTIEEVAAELFLTKAGVYHYFASKQQILEAICTRAIDAAETAVGMGMRSAGGPDARLRRMLDEYTAALMREPA